MNVFKPKLLAPFFLLVILDVSIGFGQQTNTAGGSIDYTSKVPKYRFSSTLAEQEAEIKSNPLVLRFAESRKKLKTDRLGAKVDLEPTSFALQQIGRV